ncbi:uncharacterized protein A1O9_05966 [Exophiala aquamarina CBS 119918]|uniref:RAD52 homolog n=1 Tax=Exophiala aquamarina CBS 119918 TaxID=1182545 RepID=A0A072PFI6_9EURO|nr:uncharacterized protein A1O9_05966 [Exophiala aquamarina CBS 119918]KEF58043.1 hypothetical protein A1O9_05966 [Exophiala aquamarina CBS 119918]
MPAPGDQHKPNGTTTSNPFEDTKPRIAEYTAQEIATLQSRLNKQLGPEYISARAGPGGSKVHYLAADKAISLANEVFGFNGWSSSIQNIQIDFVDENPQTGKISLGLSVIVRITLKDGAYHEDIGYGQIENCKGKAAAFEKAKKEGTTDALKRTLRNFGNILGNCVYDKTYLAKVTKLKVGAVKWDPDALHRHSDFAPKKEERLEAEMPCQVVKEASAEFDDSFDLGDFDEVDFGSVDMDHSDEVTLSAESTGSRHGPANGASERMAPPARPETITPSKPPAGATLPRVPPARPVQSAGSGPTIVPQPLPGQRTSVAPNPPNKTPSSDPRSHADQAARSSSPNLASQHCAAPLPGQGSSTAQANRTAAFYSARVATNIDANNNIIANGVSASPKFDPRTESPSIRKTSGVDHNRSVPLKRDLTADTAPHATQIINPQFDPARRVGGPGNTGQFQMSRGPSTSAYRPPTRRGPESNGGSTIPAISTGGVDRALEAVKRPPLGDVSNLQHNATALTTDGVDAKRLKVAEPESGKDPGGGDQH